MEYNQEEKNIVREQSLKNAINSLTKNRKKSTIATKDYLKNAKRHLINKNNQKINCLDDETVIRWEKFYDSIVDKKKPSDLKVAYLCGPNPLNDLQIMVKMGNLIIPDNKEEFQLLLLVPNYSKYQHLSNGLNLQKKIMKEAK